MTNLNASSRLKVKKDTFFLPDPNGGVYFRNNSSSFRIKGSTIYQWIEKLMPMFNGEHTLGELTDGLPAPYRNRVYEIGEMLYQNGFVRDVSQDRPHQLENRILKKYASQIEFLESFVDSGAFRFQVYRQAKVLAVGSGPIFVSLVSALIESGLPKFHVLITDSLPTNRLRLKELVENARKIDSEVAIEEIALEESSWREVVQSFDWILYVSQEGNVEELRDLHAICREEKKGFLPAIYLQQVGLAGPLVHPDSEGCWESAWRRIHRSALFKDRQLQPFSSTAGAMLANVIVFELFKKVTGVTKSEQRDQFFLLDLETLEGNWHSFIKHPLVTTERVAAELVQDLDGRLKQNSRCDDPSRLFHYFSQLTSTQSGIFHIWEEGGLKQLPLSQCCVQTVNPLSDGPAELLPAVVCAGLTHEESRREAGLTGIEAYVSQMVDLLVTSSLNHEEEVGVIAPQEFIGVGAGETIAEGVCRGLQKCLDEKLSKRHVNQREPIFRVRLGSVEDEHCRFYLQALTTIHGSPMIGLGEKVSGFPVVWVGTSNRWYGSAGLNITMALRKALAQALMNAQNQAASLRIQALGDSSILLNEKEPLILEIPACEETTQLEFLQSAMQVLKRNNMRLFVFDLAMEPFLKEELAGVFGVLLRKGDS
ncbi:MAG TPA: putative thiazole-containing bacteriocin maturation protein [Anoxybacillus sp.]|jgi:putative thiazole-containing bacteriocin maturation protein|nr:putative thiazole-containing bacteriocin maturation protein [Anoxybacillus sp.]